MEGVVDGMAADAEHGLGGGKQVRRHGTVGGVAGTAIFRRRGMLVDPGPNDVLVAAGTELIGPARGDALVFVGVVATHAREAALAHRVVAREAKRRGDIRVAVDTELRGGVHVGKTRVSEFAQEVPLVVVGIVAIATDQSSPGVIADTPLQVGIPSWPMASCTSGTSAEPGVSLR